MVYFPDILYFANNIKFVSFPKDIHVARQEEFLGQVFPHHYNKFLFINIKFTSGVNQNLKSKCGISIF